MGSFFQTVIDLVTSLFESIIQFVQLIVGIIEFFVTLGGILPPQLSGMFVVLLSAMLIKAVVNR